MNEVILLKCGELVLKGLNRRYFQAKLEQNLRRRLKSIGRYKVYSAQSTIYVEALEGSDLDAAYEKAKRLFGAVGVARAVVCEKNMEAIKATAESFLGKQLDESATFRVAAKRADKSFPLKSPEIAVEVADHLIDLHPHLKADMRTPDITVTVEIREDGAFIHGLQEQGAGGLPVGTNGKGALLLSGGIDSPVAGWLMARRGVELTAIHFFSYPYTSMEAKEKVVELTRIIASYAGRIELVVVPFTHIQEEIRRKAPEDMFTVVMRRFMMRIASRIAENDGCGALVTGESLGQVASQTMEAMTVTEAVSSVPVFKPLIGMDKEDIIRISRHIGAFETSTLPYEDCCTVFTPKHPVTHPKPDRAEAAEEKLDIETLVEEAVAGVERRFIYER